MKKKLFSVFLAACMMCALLTGCQSGSTAAVNSGAEQLQDVATVQAFRADAVSEEDINAIVAAAVNTSSPMNTQPWHFSVVTNKDVLAKLGDMSGFMPPRDGDGKEFEKPDMKDFSFLDDGEFEAPDGPPGQGGDKRLPENGNPPVPSDGDMPAPPSGNGPKAGIADAPLVIVISCKEGNEMSAGLAASRICDEAVLLGYGTKIVMAGVSGRTGEDDEVFSQLGVPDGMKGMCAVLIGKTDTENYDVTSSATERNPVDEVVTFVK